MMMKSKHCAALLALLASLAGAATLAITPDAASDACANLSAVVVWR